MYEIAIDGQNTCYITKEVLQSVLLFCKRMCWYWISLDLSLIFHQTKKKLNKILRAYNSGISISLFGMYAWIRQSYNKKRPEEIVKMALDCDTVSFGLMFSDDISMDGLISPVWLKIVFN